MAVTNVKRVIQEARQYVGDGTLDGVDASFALDVAEYLEAYEAIREAAEVFRIESRLWVPRLESSTLTVEAAEAIESLHAALAAFDRLEEK